jgi:integrase
MPTANITKRTVDAAEPGKGDYFVWDGGHKEAVAGFGLKVTPAGGKVYVFQYRMTRPGMTRAMPTRRLTLGKHGELTPDQARKDAKLLAAQVTRGTDPRQAQHDALAADERASDAVKQKARLDTELAFEKVAARWLAEYETGRRPRSYDQAKLVINKHLKPTLEGRPLPAITRSDLQAILDGIPARQPASRRTVYAYAAIFFGWALQRGEIAENPLQMMAKPPAAKARDRVLTDGELAVIWHATAGLGGVLGTFYRVLLLTGQRREEVAGMNWAELDRAAATWTIPAIKAKNGVAHIVPLAPAVVNELDQLALAKLAKADEKNSDAQRWPKSGAVMSIRGAVSISGFSQAKRQLDAKIAESGFDIMKPWRVHDLRRTMATGFQRLGIRFEVTEAVLNHVSGARGGVAGIYQRHDWKEEKRAALEAWARHVASILHPADKNNVVPLGTAKRSA